MLNQVKAAFGRYVETVREVMTRLKAERDAAVAKVAAVEAESNTFLNDIDVATADLMPATPPFEPSNQ